MLERSLDLHSQKNKKKDLLENLNIHSFLNVISFFPLTDTNAATAKSAAIV